MKCQQAKNWDRIQLIVCFIWHFLLSKVKEILQQTQKYFVSKSENIEPLENQIFTKRFKTSEIINQRNGKGIQVMSEGQILFWHRFFDVLRGLNMYSMMPLVRKTNASPKQLRGEPILQTSGKNFVHQKWKLNFKFTVLRQVQGGKGGLSTAQMAGQPDEELRLEL